MPNASRYVKRIISLFPITLWIERGETAPEYRAIRSQRRLNRKVQRFLRQRDRYLAEELKLRECRNDLMDEVTESVRYVEVKIDDHVHRILLGYSELDGDPAAVAAALGPENQVIFDKSLERSFVATVTIPFNARLSISRIVQALQAVITKKGGRVDYDNKEPVKQRINRGMLEFYCDQKHVPFPDEAFPDRRFARVYVDPVRSLE